jgi:hypothetical protein
MERTLVSLSRLRVAVAVLAFVGAACGGGQVVEPETGPGAAAVEVAGEQGTVRAPSAAGDGREVVGSVGSIQTVDIGGMGEVDVRVVEGRRMELVEVRLDPGWSHLVDEAEHDEIEMTFRHHDGRGVEVELELERGGVRVSVG